MIGDIFLELIVLIRAIFLRITHTLRFPQGVLFSYCKHIFV